MKLLRFFLKNAQVLEKLIIVWADNVDISEEASEEVLKYPRTSSHVAVAFPDKWRVVPRLAAAVAQEEVEAAMTAEEEEAEAAVMLEEKGGEGSDESSSGSVNTKIYFGNLPYLCDSAQLAGIVQRLW
ncbi:hypothetical protein RND71_022562 [Anisodus tanguticus]|uniref:FBD domain-containing protein n=1 Tax=Anisodus tanguticus TaxID=243964 RepID=A0AAE1RT69_9SOLA|nr:hypothetical protein RND71_022562 [Anisodus tanguticus]